jgi:dienelactone hydrolase
MSTVSDAIGYAAASPGVDGTRVALLGTSLGASLALTVASQDALVGAVAEASGCCQTSR